MRAIILVAVVALLAGCGGKSTITYYDKEGKVTSVAELTVDGVHAMSQKEVLLAYAQPVPCAGMTEAACISVNLGRNIVANGGAVKMERGMNDNEAVIGGLREFKEMIPYADVFVFARYLAKTPRNVAFNGDGNAYFTSDPVGQGNTITAPMFSPPSTVTTTTNQ